MKYVVPIAVLLALLPMLFLSGLVQMYPTVGWVDPGLYMHWFLHATENILFQRVDYHGSRLPFVLIGALFYQSVDAVLAHALLVCFYFSLGFLSVYGMASGLLQARAARLAVALTFALNVLWIASFARGYVDGPAIALGIAALACLVNHVPSMATLRLIVSGALCMAALCTHPLGGASACVAALAILMLRSESVRQFAAMALTMSAGAIACFLSLATAGTGLGLPFFFPGMTEEAFVWALSGGGQNFVVPFIDWVTGATRLLILPAILLAGFAVLRFRARKGSTDPNEQMLLAATCAPLLPLMLLPIGSVFFLQYSFYASYFLLSLIPVCILLARRVEQQHPRAFTWYLPVVVLVGGLSLFFGQQLDFSIRSMPSFPAFAWGILVLLLMAFLAGIVLRRPGPTFLVLVLMMATAGILNRDTATVLALRDGPDLLANQKVLARMQDWLSQSEFTQGPYVLWYGRDLFTKIRALGVQERYELVYSGQRLELNVLDSLAASLGWQAVGLGADMPSVDRTFPLLNVADGTDIIKLISFCPELSVCEQGYAQLRDMGLVIEDTVSLVIDEKGAPRVTVMVASLKAAAMPTADFVMRSLEELLQSGPNSEMFRSGNVRLMEISDLVCKADAHGANCNFRFSTNVESEIPTEMSFERTGLLWTRLP